MDSTQNFVKDIHEQQARNNKSKQKSSKENGSHNLPNKQHSTNK